ncbi:hypothetical protein G4V62_11200 [Bacillaceae bacterium SIJ1]|uniref:hypothetical protein n=1 Tax=Litoribacterium kuwaitense TaxID=1398745 RepID=UPI0013EC372A|nr:hypothetical protein [Litoribacterium kuwaitense]NGP45495.1 hypothetical protein [Litoribacterium kuwaitense]
MKRFSRYRMPPWVRKCCFVMEACIVPLVIFQLLRTLLFPTPLDILLLGLLIGLLLAFHLKWI